MAYIGPSFKLMGVRNPCETLNQPCGRESEGAKGRPPGGHPCEDMEIVWAPVHQNDTIASFIRPCWVSSCQIKVIAEIPQHPCFK